MLRICFHTREYIKQLVYGILLITQTVFVCISNYLGDYLDVLCGGMSQKRGCCSGGAGGTFVSINGRRNPLIIAGGGGGTRGYEEDDPDGQPGNLEVFLRDSRSRS